MVINRIVIQSIPPEKLTHRNTRKADEMPRKCKIWCIPETTYSAVVKPHIHSTYHRSQSIGVHGVRTPQFLAVVEREGVGGRGKEREKGGKEGRHSVTFTWIDATGTYNAIITIIISSIVVVINIIIITITIAKVESKRKWHSHIWMCICFISAFLLPLFYCFYCFCYFTYVLRTFFCLK